MAKTVAALFDTYTEAERVVQELVDHGFARDDISIMTHEGLARDDTVVMPDDDGPSGMAQGAGIGAALGGVGGLMIGLSALAVPGVGPVIAAGPLAAALLGAGVGAAAGGAIGALTDLGISEEHAHYYSEGVRRGGVLVTVATTDERSEQAVDIMSRHNPIDLSRRAEEWRKGGWSRFDPHSEPYRFPATKSTEHTTPAGTPTGSRLGMNPEGSPAARHTTAERGTKQHRNAEQETTVPVVEEELQVGKRATERDVRVHTSVTEKPVEEQVHLREERVSVERRPVDRPAGAADQAAFKEEVIEMTETVEEPVVNKRARVVEEVVIRKESKDRVETVHDTVRQTHVDVEQDKGHAASGSRTFETYDAGFRRHFSTTFGQQPGTTYEHYQPAYRYGYNLATNRRYTDREWDAFEADARRDWEQQHPGTWERFKAAVRHGWNEVRGRH